MKRSTMIATVMGGKAAVAHPNAAFDFLPFKIYKTGARTFGVGGWNISAQVTRGTSYYVSKTGNDSTGNGLSWATAWATVGDKALTTLAATDNAVIYVGAGRYGWSDGGAKSVLQTASKSIIGVGDVTLDDYFLGSTWALTSAQTYTYEATSTVQTTKVLDYGSLDANGDPAQYTLQTSIATVEANAGSFWWSTNKVYVHTLEEATPDADVRPQIPNAIFPRVAVNGINVYLENLKVYTCAGQMQANAASNTGNMYAKDCRFMFAPFNVAGYTAYFQNCQFAHLATDLLVGNANSTNVARIVEIDCEGWDAGVVGSSGINATTNHGAGINVIINGEYYDTYGPPVSYIQSGAAWCLGTHAHGDLAATATSFNFQELAWLDCCTSTVSTNDITTNTTAYIRDFVGGGTYGAGSTIVAY